MIALIHTTSREMNVNQFQRFALMRYWHLTKGLPFKAFLSEDELHMNDWSYGCMAKLLASAIMDAATRLGAR
jgi:acyl-CoA thioesterase I